jgi:hypothetical protein
LLRDDVRLIELRKKAFFATDPKYDGVKSAAVSHHFYLSPEELHKLFEQNSRLLDTLAIFGDFPVGGPAAEFTPVMILALKNCASAHGSNSFLFDDTKLGQKFKAALAELKGLNREKGLRLLKIYRLAEKVIDWSGTEPYLDALPEPLKFLGDKVVKGDTWGTFLAFTKEIENPRFDHVLPRLEDMNLADDSATVANEVRSANGAHAKQAASAATASVAKSAQGGSLIGKAIVVLGIVVALLTFLFAVGGILDNEYRNFRSGVIAMAICTGVIVFAGSKLFRGPK